MLSAVQALRHLLLLGRRSTNPVTHSFCNNFEDAAYIPTFAGNLSICLES